ncbi:MAG: translesion error-prone DNA polymerase V autoproteolytic subunit [Parachlamydiaceae bacterium]|nr:translesion error-prone DNA polymerase V autoproteolytic subunit [Parachlamydiaceae bacterium]
METNILNNSNSSPLTFIDIYKASIDSAQTAPIFTASIQAGFPSPADDYIEQQLDLNQLIVKHPSATFFVRVEGESMRDAGIFSGDILVVDRSLSPAHGKIIVAVIDGEFTVKRILIEGEKVCLAPENAAYQTIKVNPNSQFEVWGVVTYVIHKAK